MDQTKRTDMAPPKPGSRRARRAAERAAAAAARREATTGEIPTIVVGRAHGNFSNPVTIVPSIPFAEKMNHDLVVSRVEEPTFVRKSRKATLLQGVGFSSAAALVLGLGFGLAVENVPPSLALANSQPAVAEIANASVSLTQTAPVIEGVTAPFTVTVDGTTKKVVTGSKVSLADALSAADIKLNSEDIVSAPLDKPIAANARVRITRVTKENVSETYAIEPQATREDDPTLDKGEERIESEGVAGQGTRTVTITKHDGQEVSRTVSVDIVTQPAQPKVIKVGTKTQAHAIAPANAAPVAPGTARAIAADMVAARGWAPAEFACLDQLWQRESGWNHLAANPSSGAYGIPQSLPGSKMASAGADWQTNPATQITWGLGYISGRYGTPCNALGHSHSVGWY
ncbi:G5 domain-containing protein [Arcanobacterium pinnipediorum]|uniref:G5 domain-containing protein n=1 Tax=Arcanobacterium pinnipediorum TaxID=1503041 RepID=A0ABY5AGL8_9ACTO|nr:G5 domain-containing protein [Arcanobacterium pinnipediorum]USR79222.1 G5 domain-containing protein [Arcanobacterium pinnipediorum]